MQAQYVAIEVEAVHFGWKLGEHFRFGPLLRDDREWQARRNCPCGIITSNRRKRGNREASGNDLGDVRSCERANAQMRCVDVITGGNACLLYTSDAADE